ncbi:MAG TPA: septum formation inhibitor Maf [Gammaproteobacteria bacterium]|uniref:Maf family protein n=1 Tax=Immundisolibacter sp. TaxID=1934948 RepID=UPI000E98D10A|nr:septum formation inhibitor Maf [Gammaproteobacteria bacterium]HCZ48724.1 septum formation inhibitor Maf [Gammaproteobacteria bacterium]MCH78162.1 septum formation inhibitor Maf [Gammaproteobacteria bacterium]
MSTTFPLVLASTSVTRRQLLERLGLAFDLHAPQVDETAHPGEAPGALAERLARAKAQAVAVQQPGRHVIGSDQVAVVDGRVLGKPGDRERAARQLAMAAGRLMRFETAVCVIDGRSGDVRERRVPFEVQLRPLSEVEIARYLDREQPFDCAGALRSEGLGVTLCQRMSGDDPTALLGLPLIALCELLRECGVSLP